jgi:PAS domain S-box-containing protein
MTNKHCSKIEYGDHACLVYEKADQWRLNIIPLLKQAADSLDKVLYICSEHKKNEITKCLTSAGIDISLSDGVERFTIINWGKFFMGNGVFQPDKSITAITKEIEAAGKKGYPGIWIIGEMSWIFSQENGTRMLKEYEAGINSASFNNLPLVLVCQYDVSGCSTESVLAVLQNHPKVIYKNNTLDNAFFYGNALSVNNIKNDTGVRVWLKCLEEQQNRHMELEESEAACKAVFEATGTATAILDDVGTVLTINQRFEKTLGYSKEESEGLLKYTHFVHPEELVKFENFFTALPVAPPHSPEEQTTRIIDKQGNIKYAVITIRIIHNSFGEDAGKRVLSVLDITQNVQTIEKLEQERNRFRTLFQNVPIAITEENHSATKKYFDELRNQGVKDFREYFNAHPEKLYLCCTLGKVTGFNQALLDLWEACHPEDVIKSMALSFKNNTASARAHSDTIIKLAEGKTSFCKEEDVVTAKGNTKTVRSSVTVAPGCEETLSKIYISTIDITDLKNKTAELKRYQANLENLVRERTKKLEEETEKSKRLASEIQQCLITETELSAKLQDRIDKSSKFSRFLVHELKTPLTPMLGSIEILFQRTKGSEFERLVNNVRRGAYSLNHRVNDLLDLARGEMGLLNLAFSLTDMAELIKEVVCYMDVEFTHRKQSVIIDLNEPLPMVWADSERLRQVLLNLLGNASKFTPVEGSISINTYVEDHHMIVSIQDTGCGIKKELQENIFIDFSKSYNPLSDMGIGLPLCKLLIELHNGKIWVESEEGKGSRFLFSLPLKNSYLGSSVNADIDSRR